MANFSSPLLYGAVGTTVKSAGLLFVQSTARRLMLYEAEFGQYGALASQDCQCEWEVSRIGATNTAAGTSVLPQALDLADAAAAAGYINNLSAEPTYTTAGNGLQIKWWSINQRGGYRWRALDDGDNIIVPATAGLGLGVRTASTNYNGTAQGNLNFVER